jgi:hypothetical protein
VPALTPEDEAFLQGITDSKAFTLEAALKMYSDRPPPAEVLQALKDSSIARAIADANAAARAGTLRPLTPAQDAVIARAAPRLLRSANDTLDAADAATNSPLEPKK